MTPELIAILAVGATILGVVITGQRASRKDVADLRAEINTKIEPIRTDIGNLRAEMNTRIGDLRNELTGKISDFRTEVSGKMDAIPPEIGGLRERMAKLEGLLEGLREAISGRKDAA